MIDDALSGKIDLIITKSVSRFARNTVDSLSTIRELKEKGVEVYFEKENIWTFDAKGELLITIMSSLAQEESRSISENTTWGRRRQFAEGKCSVAYSHFLGYDKGPDGEFVVNEKEAETVRLIFKLYLSGLKCPMICKKLEEKGIKSPFGLDNWSASTVNHMLSNEKYIGDALLQKCYTPDFLTHKMVKNNGEVPQYYVEDHHEAIIDKATYKLVQEEKKNRKNRGPRYQDSRLLSSKLICGDCGHFYGHKIWHSNKKYRKEIWRCNNKYHGEVRCTTPIVMDEDIKKACVKAINIVITNKDTVMEELRVMKKKAYDTKAMKKDAAKLKKELEALEKEAGEYDKRADDYKTKSKELEALEDAIASSEAKAIKIGLFMERLRKLNLPIKQFKKHLWAGMVENVIVMSDGTLVFRFQGGYEVTV